MSDDHDGEHEGTHEATPPRDPARWRELLRLARPVSEPEPPVRDASFWEGLVEELEAPGFDRRAFLQLCGASMALAGVAGCTPAPADAVIVPYRAQPPEVTPGVASFYATSMLLDGYAVGLLAESHEGRPTKLEGNPDHPASLGATGVFEQASVLDLYNPMRVRRVMHAGLTSAWNGFVAEAGAASGPLARTHFVLEPTSSPSMSALVARVRAGGAAVSFFAALAPHGRWRATRAVFGRVLAPQYDLAPADVVVALDADFLSSGPGHIPWARAFADRRRPEGMTELNRLYAFEPALTPTGSVADHHLAVPASLVTTLAARLLVDVARATGRADAPGIAGAVTSLADRSPKPELVAAMARDLVRRRGRGLVIAGDRQPALTHALAYAINELLGNVGATVRFTQDAVLEAGEPSHDLGAVADRLRAGDVDRLVTIGVNPAYAGPADVDFGAAMKKAKVRVAVAAYPDATTDLATWIIPQAHYLETWGDGRAYDGTISFAQPLVRPLFDSRSAAEVLATFLGQASVDARSLLREQWRGQIAREPDWLEALRRGMLDHTAFPAAKVAVDWRAVGDLARAVPPQTTQAGQLELNLAPDLRVHDGRFARNAWLLELPQPFTTLSWDNAARLGPQTAAALGVRDGDVVAVARGTTRVEVPVLVDVGHAEGAVSVSLGWGQKTGHDWADVGANAYPLRTRVAPFIVQGVTVAKTGRRRSLAVTQPYQTTFGRKIALAVTADALAQGDNPAAALHHPLESFHDRLPTASTQWGMSIDQSACIGCGACVVACQAENNVPVVGYQGVLKNRQMHWLRIDHYDATASGRPVKISQPMACQHCEKAPCEYVCPVHATVHSEDGLNEMVYNRCVGTRFCSNNCPYKVRRFNWFNYHRDDTETVQMQHNPDVTVRGRGVMEKCTYCVQRIRRVGIVSRVTNTPPPHDEPQTACAQACPTRAIVFGNIRDPQASVTGLRELPRAYGVLHEIGTEPRTRYLMKVLNPNPEIDHA